MVIEVANDPMLAFWEQGKNVLGKPLVEAVPELASQPFLTILAEVFTTGIPYEAKGARADLQANGQLNTFYFDFTYTPLRNADDDVYAVMAMAVDVTEQVISRQQLEASEAFARNLFQSSPVANLVLLGEDMTVQTINEGMLQMLGRDRTIIGKPLMEAVPELQPTPLLERLRHVLNTGTMYHQPEEQISLVRFGQPYTGYFHYIYTPFIDTSGLPSGVVVTAIEVTTQVLARQQVEESETRYRQLSQELDLQVQQRTEELASANAELTANNEQYAAINQKLEEANSLLIRSNENLQTFAYVASHDLQEPLRKIQQFGDLLHTQYGPYLGDGIDYLERMQLAASRMSTLIKDLLTFSRISTRRDTSAPTSLNDIVASVLIDLELPINEREAQVSVSSLPTVSGDASQLGQLFQNLLSNALKFRREDVVPQIMVRSELVLATKLPPSIKPTRQTPAYYQIDVTDNGIGFDEKYLDRIFQVFQRLHGRKQFDGTGIGLSICEKVVTNHGGAITATSQPGQGATFSIYLPV
ncbi:PAS domain-containing protein [Spirosoma sp. KUDC1026]|nr:PAS domain-containing protein [Spirosoma sp. KUDC1026]